MKINAQPPLLEVNFEDESSFRTTHGINGKAFDLGDVSSRLAIEKKNPLNSGDSFTITVWVKGDRNASMCYNILTGIAKTESDDEGWKHRMIGGIRGRPIRNFNGWKIGMQDNGAWRFTAKGKGGYTYLYEPTPIRQTIRNGEWHLLAITYESKKSILEFYYDGAPVAVYNAPYLKDMVQADAMIIGNSAHSEHNFRESEWDSFYGQIDDILVYNRVLDEADIVEYYYETMGTEIPKLESQQLPETLKVTTLNIYHGGNETGKEVGKRRIIELLKKNKADIYALVETYGSVEAIADVLGYQLYLISSNLSIISRYPITDTHHIFKPFNSGGAQVMLPGGREVNIFNIWLTHLPEYKKRFFKSDTVDVEEYLENENRRRGRQMEAILNEIKPDLTKADEVPLILTGDFNSGSHLDWTKSTALKHNNYIIPWPVSIAAADAGLQDSYRQIHTDPQKYPGVTFSMHNNSDTYIKDRIDYIYYKGEMLSPVNSTVINHHPVTFPSDHAGVSTIFKLRKE